MWLLLTQHLPLPRLSIAACSLPPPYPRQRPYHLSHSPLRLSAPRTAPNRLMSPLLRPCRRRPPPILDCLVAAPTCLPPVGLSAALMCRPHRCCRSLRLTRRPLRPRSPPRCCPFCHPHPSLRLRSPPPSLPHCLCCRPSCCRRPLHQRPLHQRPSRLRYLP